MAWSTTGSASIVSKLIQYLNHAMWWLFAFWQKQSLSNLHFLPHPLPLFYPIQSASTPPGARYFLGSLRKRRSSWSCLGAAPAMVTSYATCLLSGWNQQNWHVCVRACTYVRTYKSFMRILCMYIYICIHVYTFIVDDYVILLLLPIPLRLPLLSLFLRFFLVFFLLLFFSFFFFFLFFFSFFSFFFFFIIIIFFFFFVLFFFLLLIVLSSSPTSSSSIHQQNQQHLVPIDFSQHTQNIKSLEGHHAPQSVKVLVSLSTFGCPAQTNQFLGCANERMPGGRDRLVIEVPVFPDLQTLTSQKYRT